MSLFKPVTLLASSSRTALRVATPALRRSVFDGAQRTTPGSGSGSGVTAAIIDERVLEGLDHFLPKQSFETIQTWQSSLWEKLQAEIRSNPLLEQQKTKWDAGKFDIVDIISASAREPQLALAFNYASLLLNNSYFLEGLAAEQMSKEKIPERYRSLQEKVEGYAEGMVGGGWLWLVKQGNIVDVVPTYGSGTILIANHQMRGRESDRQIAGQPSDSDVDAESASPKNQTSGPVSGLPTPLAVLSLFEHAYVGAEKYGVNGRVQYARDWWGALNWDKISNTISK